MGDTVVKSVCRGCHGVCGVKVHLRDGVVVKVTGDRDCPTSLGYICAKGRDCPQLLDHSDRVKYAQGRDCALPKGRDLRCQSARANRGWALTACSVRPGALLVGHQAEHLDVR